MSTPLTSIRSFIVQIGGGLLSLSKTVKTAKLGLHVVTGGLIFQQALIAFFLAMTIRYTMKLKRTAMAISGGRRGPGRMVHILQASLMLITVSGPFLLHRTFTDLILVPYSLPPRRVLLQRRLFRQ
jgi:hypothetical protein